MFTYLHIPFCRQKCRYCKFALTPVFDRVKVRTYLDALKREIEAFFREPHSVQMESLSFGGGTPSILSVEEVEELIGTFRKYASFSEGAEIAFEANPEDITPEYLHGIAAAGVNRLSLGVQTLSDASLQAVGRSGSPTIFRALDGAGKSPIENISVDLIAGLPHAPRGQTVADVAFLLDHFPIRHVSVYMLESGLYPKDWEAVRLPDEQIVEEYLNAAELLRSRGFVRYELSNFALPGYESRHNRAYWDHSDIRGFGLSASSFLAGRRFANASSFASYYRGEREYEEVLTPEQLRLERLMFGLRTSGVDRSDIANTAALERFMTEGKLED